VSAKVEQADVAVIASRPASSAVPAVTRASARPAPVVVASDQRPAGVGAAVAA
jgi:hypothetical protein